MKALVPAVFALAAITRILRSGMPLPLKVLSSWLIAVVALAATLELLPVTPGYLPDHLD